MPQNAFWSWYETMDRDDTPRLNRTDENCPACTLPTQKWEEKYSAFSVAELGKILPWGIPEGNPTYTTLKILKSDDGDNEGWIVVYDNKIGRSNQEGADTLADAMGKMLIHLIEAGILPTK